LHFTDGFVYWESLQNTKDEDGEIFTPKAPEILTPDIHSKLASLHEPTDKSAKMKPCNDDPASRVIFRAETMAAKSLALKHSLDTRVIGSWNQTSRFCLADMPELRQVLYRVVHGPQQSSVFDRMIVPFDYARPSNSQGLEAEVPSPLDWFKIVEFYSTTCITHFRDRLIAISGLARHIHRRIGVPYYCGLWADRFLNQLLWFRGGPSFAWPPQSRAPSWSWASVDGEVLYPLDVHKLTIDPNIQVLGLAAEPMVRGAAISRTSWLGGLGSPILQVKIREISDPGYWISGDEDLGTGPRKSRQTSFSLLKFRSNILSMRLRYSLRTVGLVVWDDNSWNGDKSPAELQAMVSPLFCVRIAQMDADVGPETTTSSALAQSNEVPRRRPRNPLLAQYDNDDEPSPSSVLPPTPVPSTKESGTSPAKHRPTNGQSIVFLVLFLVPIDAAESTFRRVGCGQVSPEFAQHSDLWEDRTIAII
jgi:hypothetical protein